jgi:hypothetical protein
MSYIGQAFHPRFAFKNIDAEFHPGQAQVKLVAAMNELSLARLILWIGAQCQHYKVK